MRELRQEFKEKTVLVKRLYFGNDFTKGKQSLRQTHNVTGHGWSAVSAWRPTVQHQSHHIGHQENEGSSVRQLDLTMMVSLLVHIRMRFQ